MAVVESDQLLPDDDHRASRSDGGECTVCGAFDREAIRGIDAEELCGGEIRFGVGLAWPSGVDDDDVAAPSCKQEGAAKPAPPAPTTATPHVVIGTADTSLLRTGRNM